MSFTRVNLAAAICFVGIMVAAACKTLAPARVQSDDAPDDLYHWIRSKADTTDINHFNSAGDLEIVTLYGAPINEALVEEIGVYLNELKGINYTDPQTASARLEELGAKHADVVDRIDQLIRSLTPQIDRDLGARSAVPMRQAIEQLADHLRQSATNASLYPQGINARDVGHMFETYAFQAFVDAGFDAGGATGWREQHNYPTAALKDDVGKKIYKVARAISYSHLAIPIEENGAKPAEAVLLSDFINVIEAYKNTYAARGGAADYDKIDLLYSLVVVKSAIIQTQSQKHWSYANLSLNRYDKLHSQVKALPVTLEIRVASGVRSRGLYGYESFMIVADQTSANDRLTLVQGLLPATTDSATPQALQVWEIPLAGSRSLYWVNPNAGDNPFAGPTTAAEVLQKAVSYLQSMDQNTGKYQRPISYLTKAAGSLTGAAPAAQKIEPRRLADMDTAMDPAGEADQGTSDSPDRSDGSGNDAGSDDSKARSAAGTDAKGR